MQKNSTCPKQMPSGKSAPALLVFVLLWLIFPLESASAHKATIFAWIQGDTVHTQSKLSGGKRVKGGEVVVFDRGGVQLLKGKTDDNGMFAFTIPQKTELKIVLKASMGHQAEWMISPEEMGAYESEKNPSETVKTVQTKTTMGSKDVQTNETLSKRTDVGLTKEDVQKIIDDALEKKLEPILEKMAQTSEKGPGLTEIIGGIGYIVGLMGVLLMVTCRRR